MGKLTHDFKPMNSYLLMRVPKKIDSQIKLTAEAELELAQGLVMMVIDVAEEAKNRGIEPGDGVYFGDQITNMDMVPVKWIEEVKKEIVKKVNKTPDMRVTSADQIVEEKEYKMEEVHYDVCVKHISRIVGVRKGMYKKEL